MRKFIFVFTVSSFLMTTSVSGQTKSLVIPGTAFAPVNEASLFISTSDYTSAKAGSPIGLFHAPVCLPEGAKVVKMTVFFYDAGEGDIDVYLFEYNLYTRTESTKFFLTTSGDSGYGYQSDSTGYVRIKNTGYQYVLRVNFDSSSLGSSYRIYGVKLIYNE